MVWRTLGPTEAKPLYKLLRHLEQVEQAPYRTSFDEVEAMLVRQTGSTSIGGFPRNDDAEMIAFGHVGLSRDGLQEAHCQGGVHADWRSRGLGGTLLRWQTEHGKILLKATFSDSQSRLMHMVGDKYVGFQNNLTSLGFQWQGSFVELRLDLNEIPSKTKLAGSLEIVKWTADWDDLARRAYNRVHAELDGPKTRVGTAEWELTHADLDRSMSYLAVDRSGDRPWVVGFIGIGCYEQDWDALGWSEGLINIVAVFETENRDNILMALVRSAMKALKRAELQKLGVSLDPAEDEQMMNFYIDLGFKVTSWTQIYAMPVEPDQ